MTASLEERPLALMSASLEANPLKALNPERALLKTRRAARQVPKGSSISYALRLSA